MYKRKVAKYKDRERESNGGCILKWNRIEDYKELRKQSLGSWFLGVSEEFASIKAYRITKIDPIRICVFSTYHGEFRRANFNGSLRDWNYYKVSSNNPNFFTYINLFTK